MKQTMKFAFLGCIVVIGYLYWYCKKIKANPERKDTYLNIPAPGKSN